MLAGRVKMKLFKVKKFFRIGYGASFAGGHLNGMSIVDQFFHMLWVRKKHMTV